jgi:hypothetical protein
VHAKIILRGSLPVSVCGLILGVTGTEVHVFDKALSVIVRQAASKVITLARRR